MTLVLKLDTLTFSKRKETFNQLAPQRYLLWRGKCYEGEVQKASWAGKKNLTWAGEKKEGEELGAGQARWGRGTEGKIQQEEEGPGVRSHVHTCFTTLIWLETIFFFICTCESWHQPTTAAHLFW